MNIVPPSRRPKEVRITTRPKAVVATAVSVFWLLICLGAWSLGWSLAAALSVLSVQIVLVAATACLWRFERPREVRFKGHFPEPPIIHGT